MPGAEPPLSPTAEDEPLSTDPANWPSPLTDRIRTELVHRGPSRLPPDFFFHMNESDGRSCHHQYFRKILVSGEKMADIFHEEQQTVLLLLQIVFQEEHSFNKFRNGKLETCEHSHHMKTVQNTSIA